MKRFPGGISSGELRRELRLEPEEQAQLDRRRRELRRWFEIETVAGTILANGIRQRTTLYVFRRERREPLGDAAVNRRLRAEVLGAAHGRCGMCGKTIEADGIKLVVDHKLPLDWGGASSIENLWALCEDCNAGKKAHFSSLSVDREMIRLVSRSSSVHVRIGELLKAVGAGKPTPAALLEIVANQEDWHKRLRELRYPVIGWKIDTRRRKLPSGRITADYVLRESRPWPDDPTGVIRKFEQERQRSRQPRHPEDADDGPALD